MESPLIPRTNDESSDSLHYLPKPLPVSLSLENVSYKVPQKRGCISALLARPAPPPIEILTSVSCYVKPSALVAVLGSSGAGKTTLLDILADRNKSGKIDGKLYINDEESSRSSITLKSVSSYVVQEDEYIPTLTVAETLGYAQRMFLKNPSKDHIDILLEALRLTKVKNTIVGSADVRGVSGGQRRRLSIALGLLSNPSVLLLDEPTSGLDSPNALRVVKSLNQLSNHGLSIICSIHQPRSSIFHKFDLLLILHKGTTVYFGPAAAAAGYFESHLHYPLPVNTNPADYFLDVLETDQKVLARNFSSETAMLYYSQHESEYDYESPILGFSLTAEGQEMLDEIKRIRETQPLDFEGTRIPATRFQRTNTLIMRTFKAKFRAGREFFVAPIVCCALALLCGTLFGDIPVWDGEDWKGDPVPYYSGYTKRMAVILFSIIMFSLQSLPQLGKQVQERAAFQRDRAGGLYSVLEYFTAMSITDTPLHIVMVSVFSIIIYKTVHLFGNFWFFMLGMYVVLLFGYSAAHLIILFSSDAISALSACMALIAYSFLLNGQVINRYDMAEGAMWTYNTSFIYNALEMITISEMESPEMIGAFGPVNSTDNPLKSYYDFDPQDKVSDRGGERSDRGGERSEEVCSPYRIDTE
ncbi:hypothetical protein TL16_g08596 [Triparma laevis f. inornata]|uniref:ABC transporter domain-containing protein n=1 Tax=Triparma laevis f. inornata TaxID=1714386 RepID=A0A9W7B6L6_9STRA|nr:hypothetical protein TL16_g08596 [Triparma laevis f. inornata]